MNTQNKASWEDNIKKEFEEKFVYSDGVIDEDAEEVWEWIKKNFVHKDEVRKASKLCDYRPADFNKFNGLYQNGYEMACTVIKLELLKIL